MPDYTHCVNNDCPYRLECSRFTAEPAKWQSVCKFEFDVIKVLDGFIASGCENFIRKGE